MRALTCNNPSSHLAAADAHVRVPWIEMDVLLTTVAPYGIEGRSAARDITELDLSIRAGLGEMCSNGAEKCVTMSSSSNAGRPQ
jgi:hypothetical protein